MSKTNYVIPGANNSLAVEPSNAAESGGSLFGFDSESGFGRGLLGLGGGLLGGVTGMPPMFGGPGGFGMGTGSMAGDLGYGLGQLGGQLFRSKVLGLGTGWMGGPLAGGDVESLLMHFYIRQEQKLGAHLTQMAMVLDRKPADKITNMDKTEMERVRSSWNLAQGGLIKYINDMDTTKRRIIDNMRSS